jgi:hypothetical protein
MDNPSALFPFTHVDIAPLDNLSIGQETQG